MGLMGGMFGAAAAGAAQGAGETGVKLGETYVKQQGELNTAKALESIRADHAVALAKVQSGLRTDEFRANKGAEAEFLPGELETRGKAAVKTAEDLGPVAAKNQGLLEQTKIDTAANPENVRKGAQAKVDELKITGPAAVEQANQVALGAAKTAKVLAADPAYLAAQRAITSATESSATRAAAAHSMMETALGKVKLEAAQGVQTAQKAYQAAVASGDQTKIDTAKEALKAADYNNAQEKAELTAKASVIHTLSAEVQRLTVSKATAMGDKAQEENIQRQIDNAARQLDTLMTDYKKSIGVKEGPTPKGEATAIPAAAIDMLKKNPKAADQFDAKYGKGSAAKYLEAAKPGAAAADNTISPTGALGDALTNAYVPNAVRNPNKTIGGLMDRLPARPNDEAVFQ